MEQTWRDLLSNLIKEPRERKRIAKITGVDALTLASWATHTTTPTSHQLRKLLQAIPQHQMLLHTLIVEEFEEFDTDQADAASTGSIPFTFPARVLEILANAPEESRFWSICTAVLHEAVQQLAPTSPSISLSVVQCMPPSSPQGYVHCLREYIALGTPPWLDQVEMRTSFLGAESLAGSTVSSALPRIIEDTNQEQRSTYLPEYAMSAAAFPIIHANRIAGCFLTMSTQTGYFSSSTRQHLMQNYTALLALAFSPTNFYEREQIALQIMPPLQVQQPYLSTFQQRVLATLKTAFSVNRSLSYLEAQQHVYAQIAQELMQIQPHT
jgi:hypothetical protein